MTSDARRDIGELAICSTPQTDLTLDQTGFEALTYVTITGVGRPLGRFGFDQPFVDFEYQDGTQTSARGTKQFREVTPNYTPQWDDAGQDVLRALSPDNDYVFAVKRLNYNRLDAAGTDGVEYALCKVTYPQPVNDQEFLVDAVTMKPIAVPVVVEPTSGS